MTVILQVSDPHFGAERPAVVEALIALSKALSPDLLVLSGDITQRARSRQFAAAAAFVRTLSVPNRVIIPGNHDIPLINVATRFIDPYGPYKKEFGEDLEPSFDSPDCLVLGVKTTRRYRHTDGEISEEQRERVSRRLRDASASQLRIVVVHQPVAVPRDAEVHNIAHGSHAAIAAWSDAGADVILGGHIHLPFVLALHQMTPLSRPLWAVNAGTAVSHRIRKDAGNSVNVIRTSLDAPRSCVLEQWMYRAPGSAFVRASEQRLG